MKKILLLGNILFSGLLIFVSCNKTNISTADDIASGKSGTAGKTGSAATAKLPCPDCFDHTLTRFNGVNAETALMMSNNYKQIDQPLLQIPDGGDGIEDANSIWFSLESLKNFIWKIEQASCGRNCANNLKLGIRIYYGRYPTTMQPLFPSLGEDFAQHHTLFMVPTFQDFSNPQVHWDFDPWHWGNNNCRPTTMSEYFAHGHRPFGSEKSLIFSIDENQYFRAADGTLSSALNHGGLIPPFNATGTGY
jgi:hypothetical protein